uniref:RHD domain-containing protein n=1 Tax=Homalodisca liturata TaxID=320908 RepID=A0A1B6J8B0_9HEMI
MPTTAFNPGSLTFRPTLPPPWINNNNNQQQNTHHFYSFPAGNTSSPGSSSESSASSQASSYNENSNSPLRSPDTTTYEEIGGMSKAYLKIIEQPHAGFRFRYKTEMQGTHGAIFGTQSQKNRSKSFPKVKLCNYKHRPGDNQPFIRCTLFTGDPDVAKRTHHVHRLVCKMTGTVRDDPHDIQVKAPDYVAHFQQMTILYTKKEDQLAVLLEKKQYHTRRRYTDIRNNYDFPIEELRAKCVEEIKSINFHVACLRFEALVDNGKGKYIPLCPPVYSNIINNLKNPQTSELKICRMDQCMGPCQGGQEIFMFVEKVVKKNIKVKFYEEDENSDVIWEDYAEFRPEDVHHQYGIVFKTPPYRNNNLKESEGNVTVYCQLERPSDSAVSEPRKYQYTPNPSRTPILSRKRPRNAIYARQLQRIPSVVTDNYCPTYQPPNELPKESFVPCPAVPAVPEPINTDSLYDISLFNDLPDLMADDLLNDFMLNDEQHMDISSVTMPIVEAPQDSTSSTVSLHYALHQMAGADPGVSQVISNERFNEYLEAIGSSDVSSQIMSLHVSSSNNVEQYVTDGCAAPVDRPEGSNVTAPTERRKENQGRKKDAVRDSLTGDDIVERIEKSVTNLVKLQETRKMSDNQLRKYICDLIRYASIVHTGDSVLHVLAASEKLPLSPKAEKLFNLLKSHKILETLEFKNKRQETPLLVAARWGVPDMVSLLLDAGASVTATDCDNNTALHLAVLRDNRGLDVLSVLLPRCLHLVTNNNQDGFTALHLAVKERKVDIVSSLCVKSDNGLYPNDLINCQDNKHGNTALHIAVSHRFKDIVTLLLNFEQLNVNAKNFGDRTPLSFVWSETDKEAEDIREALILNKADLSLVDTKPYSKKDECKDEYDEDSDDDVLHIAENEQVDDSLSAYAREWDFTSLFDTKTVSKLCLLLDKNKDWEILAKKLNFKRYELEFCHNYWSGSLVLFKLISTYRPHMTADTIRDLLLEMPARLHVGAQYIDDMELEKLGM